MARGKLSPRRQLKLQRQADAVAMRLRGKSYSQIAEVLGITKQRAHQLVMQAFEEMRQQCAEDTEQLRAIELARLDRITETFAPMLEMPGLDLQDVEAAKKAADVLIKVSERRAKLLGLDAPTRAELTGKDGQPFVAGVFAIPQPAKDADVWAAQAQEATGTPPAELPMPSDE